MMASVLRSLCLMASAGATLWACSGGTDSGPISGPGPGRDETPDVHQPGDGNPFDIQSGPGPGPGSTGTGGTCITCSDVYAGVIGGTTLCEDSEQPFQTLYSCSCTSCSSQCQVWCNDPTSGVDATCGGCQQTICPTELANCLSN